MEIAVRIGVKMNRFFHTVWIFMLAMPVAADPWGPAVVLPGIAITPPMIVMPQVMVAPPVIAVPSAPMYGYYEPRARGWWGGEGYEGHHGHHRHHHRHHD